MLTVFASFRLPLESVAEPQKPVTEASTGQLVTVDGELLPGDFMVLEKRINDGDQGYWVIGHLITDDGFGLAVALGWAETEQQAEDARARLEADAPIPASVTMFPPCCRSVRSPASCGIRFSRTTPAPAGISTSTVPRWPQLRSAASSRATAAHGSVDSTVTSCG